MESSQQFCDVGTAIILILQGRKLRSRKVNHIPPHIPQLVNAEVRFEPKQSAVKSTVLGTMGNQAQCEMLSSNLEMSTLLLE